MEDQQRRLAELGVIIAEKRDEAIAARSASGIEEIWMQAEESYLGIDDNNRSEFTRAKWAKPTSMEGPITTSRTNNLEVRSSVFVRLTSRYVDAGSAKLGEILLPIDDKPFSFSHTPIPTLVNGKEDLTEVTKDGAPLMKSGTDGQPVKVTVSDLVKQELEKATDAAEKAEKRIYDWMVECNYHGEVRKVIFDSARIGVGVLKGPVPRVERGQAINRIDGGIELKIVEEIKPGAKWVDPWNIFPDASCGENIHDGDHILERDYLSPRMLKELKRKKGYLGEQIDKVLKEGPGKCYTESVNPRQENLNKKRFEVWYFYGTLSRTDMMAMNAIGANALPEDRDDVYVIVTLVNDTVIRAVINPLNSGKFPYHAMPWTRRAGLWAGVGIAEQISVPQRMCNAATRAMLNNAGKSAGSQIVIDQTSIVPADQSWILTPDKIWFKSGDSTVDDVRKAFMAVTFPNMQPQLMAIIEYAFKLAEESSNIPLISQGQTGPTTPETLGATELQNNNANTLLRSIGYSFDDFITDPVVHQFYEWLLLDPSVPEDEKGDYQINAHGSIALVERAIQDQTLQLMGPLVTNPALKIDPAKWIVEWLKSKRLDPRKLQYSEEDQKKMDEAPPPPPVPIAVAQINAESREKIAGLSAQENGQPTQDKTLEVATIRADSDLKKAEMVQAADMEELRFKADQANFEREHDRQMKMMDLQMKQMEFAEKRGINLDQVKAELAQTSMKLQTQKELSAASLGVDVHKHNNPQVTTPPTEPAGRAEPGKAYQQ